MDMIEAKKIGSVQVEDTQIIFTDKENTVFYKTGVMNDPTLTQRLYDSGAKFAKNIEQVVSPRVSILFTMVFPSNHSIKPRASEDGA